MGPILLSAGAACLLAVLGAAAGAAFGVSHRRLCFLISLGAGALLAVAALETVPEAADRLGAGAVAGAFASGYALFYAIGRFLHHVCPACAASHLDESVARRFREIAALLLFALVLHATLDGVALSLRFPSSGRTNAPILAAVSFHKIPEGLALGAILLAAGFGRGASVLWTGAVQLSTLIGGIAGHHALAGAGPAWIAGVAAHVGGQFAYLGIHAISGEIFRHDKRGTVLAALLGAGGVAALHFLEA